MGYTIIPIYNTIKDLLDNSPIRYGREFTIDELAIAGKVELITNAADRHYELLLEEMARERYPNVVAFINYNKEVHGRFYEMKSKRTMIVSADVVVLKK